MNGAQGDTRRSNMEPEAIQQLSSQAEDHLKRERHKGHGLLMLVFWVPMLVIAVVLVVSGVVNPAFLITAAACALMMIVMMRMMPGH